MSLTSHDSTAVATPPHINALIDTVASSPLRVFPSLALWRMKASSLSRPPFHPLFHPHVLPLLLLLLFLSSLSSVATAAPSPSIQSIFGCISSGNIALACHTNTQLTITGYNFITNDPTSRVNIGPYLCLNVAVVSPTSLRCRVPPVAPIDVERQLDVNVTFNGNATASLRKGVQSYGELSVVSVTGCPNSTFVGNASFPAYRTSGCTPDRRINVTGTGFGSSLSVRVTVAVVSPTVGDLACLDVAVYNGTLLRCTLPTTAGPPAVWLPVRVYIGMDTVLVADRLQYSAAPFISAVQGCLTVNSSLTGLCHTDQVLTIRGTNFQGPKLNVTIGRYNCSSPRFLSTLVVTCTLPNITREDVGRWLTVVVVTSNGTAVLERAVQSYGVLRVTGVRGCNMQRLNTSLVATGCAQGGNLTVLGEGFTPTSMVMYVQTVDARSMCSRVLHINSSALICVGLPLPSLADVLIPVIVGVTLTRPALLYSYSTPLISFTVTPRITRVDGCIPYQGLATECHPSETFTIYGTNFTSQAVVSLLGHNRHYQLYVWSTSATSLSVYLPSQVDAVDEAQLLGVAVRVGNSTVSAPTVMWMVNALTVTGVQGCYNQTTANSTSLCVAGVVVRVTGTGFTPTSNLFLLSGMSTQLCAHESFTVIKCRLIQLPSTLTNTPLSVYVVSGRATSLSLPSAVSYIPTPTIRSVGSTQGCSQPVKTQTPRDCTPYAVLTINGTNIAPFTSVWLSLPGQANYPCAVLQYAGSTGLTCMIPPMPGVANVWLTLQLNSSLPSVSGPTTFLSRALHFAGESPTDGGRNRWGLTIDELILLIVLVSLVVVVLLVLQSVWCLTRYGGMKFPRLERVCPRMMTAMKGGKGREDDGRGGIHLGLLQNDQVQFDPSQPQPSEGRRTPYTPFALAMQSQQPQPSSGGQSMHSSSSFAPNAGFQAYHLPPPSTFPSHLVPPGSEGTYAQPQYNYSSAPAPSF